MTPEPTRPQDAELEAHSLRHGGRRVTVTLAGPDGLLRFAVLGEPDVFVNPEGEVRDA
jgi:hypothetical protein